MPNPNERKQLDPNGLAHLWEKFKEQNNVFSNTTAGWAEQISLVSKRGAIQIYTDFRQNDQGEDIAAYKVGDGSAYVVDLPFTEELIYDHINDSSIHVTAQEKAFWNNKVRGYVDSTEDLECLTLTTN